MSQSVELESAKTRLAELIEAARCGEDVIITREDKPMAKIVAVEQEKKRRKPGSAKGLITMSDDFDAPLDDFKEYM